MTKIIGTSWSRVVDASQDLTLALAFHPERPGLWVWCVGCVLAPTWEFIVQLEALENHVRDHLRAAT